MNDDHSDDEAATEGPTWRERFRAFAVGAENRAQRVEARYLLVLRYSLLVLATLLLLLTLWLFFGGLAKQVGSSTIEPEQVAVDPSEIAPSPPTSNAEETSQASDAENGISDGLRRATLQTYRSAFAPYERRGENPQADRILTTIWPEERQEYFRNLVGVNIVDSEGNLVSSSEQLSRLAIQTVGLSAKEPGFVGALQAYRDAKEVRVCENVTRTRQRTVDSWDPLSTACDDWYIRPYGCASTRTVSEPYSERVCEMRLPADLEAPWDAMGSAVERFAATAEIDSEQARNNAIQQSADAGARKRRGRDDLVQSGQVFLAFLALMLLYLFVVLERHHRALQVLVRSKAHDQGV